MIGILDSGIGGLTVVRKIETALPELSIRYVGDTARAPYGDRAEDTILRSSIENASFLVRQGVGAILITSHTMAAVAGETLRRRFSIPVYDLMSGCCEDASRATRFRRIGVIGSRAAIRSDTCRRILLEMMPDALVYAAVCPLLIPLVEEGRLKKPETAMIVKKYLLPLKTRRVDTLILGCTHYALLRDVIQRKIGKRVRLIDPGDRAVPLLRQWMASGAAVLPDKSGSRFFLSDAAPYLETAAAAFLHRRVQLEPVIC